MRTKRFPDWDWRIWGSSLLTILWLGAGAAYLATAVGWSFWQAEVDDIGGFFEGFFAPLAFLWLVVGLFIQQKELARTRDEMERANVLSAQQAAAIEASALTARQQAFFLIAENVRRQTGNLLGAMLASHENDLVGSAEELEEHLAAHAAGDFERFPRLFLNFDSALGEGNFGRVGADADFFFGSPFRASLSDEYIRSFRRLLRLARECDTGDTIRGTVTHAPPRPGVRRDAVGAPCARGVAAPRWPRPRGAAGRCGGRMAGGVRSGRPGQPRAHPSSR